MQLYGRGIFDRQLLSAGVSFTTPLTKGILRVETTRSIPGIVQGCPGRGGSGTRLVPASWKDFGGI